MGSLGDAALVGLGGALGSIGRWLVGVALASASATFPYGTFTVNMTGAFVGILAVLRKLDPADNRSESPGRRFRWRARRSSEALQDA